MARPATVSADQIRTAVLAMLAEAGNARPSTGERFRQVVSVRKLRARLGAGDPATLSRALNEIEAEVVCAGLTEVAIPDLPPAIAEHMRALWQEAVGVQIDDVVRLRAETAHAAEASDAARRDAELRTEMLRVELADLRTQLGSRDDELASLRADSRSLTERAAASQTATAELRKQLDDARAALAAATQAHADEFAAVHTRYEGLSKQLLQETAHQRDAFRAERERLTSDVTKAVERAAALEGLRDRLLAELASERDAHQRAAAEARALTTVIAEQRILLQAGHSIQANARRPARPAAAPSRHRRNPGAKTSSTPAPSPSASTARRKAR